MLIVNSSRRLTFHLLIINLRKAGVMSKVIINRFVPASWKPLVAASKNGANTVRVAPLSYSRVRNVQHPQINSLEDLTKLKSLEGVDPELIRKLINERTSELNVQNELDMLKRLSKEEQNSQEISLKRFVRPLWMFFLMSSTVYLILHYVWWRLEIVERAQELQNVVQSLEVELDQVMKSQQPSPVIQEDTSKENRPWYKKLFY